MVCTGRFAVVTLAAALGLLWAPAARAEVDEATRAALAKGNNEFSAALHGQLRGKEGNLFYSPYSIRTALAMAYAGARGNTAQQMRKVLALNVPDAQVHEGLAALSEGMVTGGRGDHAFKLHIANSLWGQKDYGFGQDFLDLVEDGYGAGLREVDYIRATEEARKAINQWVEDATQEKIKDLVPEGALKATTRMVLANAIYFKADWISTFSERATRDDDFWTAPEVSVKAATMHQTAQFGYAESDTWQMVEMHYHGGKSMVVVLPRERDGLVAVEENLATVLGQGVFGDSRRSRRVNVSLPKFKFTAQMGLAQALTSMGMGEAFDPDAADFSGMTTRERLFIDAVLHKAYVDVYEKGTEAAAATAVMMGTTSMPIDEPVEFRADRPFLFAIRDVRTGTLLFLGRVKDPTK